MSSESITNKQNFDENKHWILSSCQNDIEDFF